MGDTFASRNLTVRRRSRKSGYEAGRRSILARLENPDDAMIEALSGVVWPHKAGYLPWPERARMAIRGLAAVMDKDGGDDGKG